MNERSEKVERNQEVPERDITRPLKDLLAYLNDRIDVHNETWLESIRSSVERGVASAKRIALTLDEMRYEWPEKWAGHDRLLKDHGERITALQQRKGN